MIKHICEQKSEQWHNLRWGLITGTRAKEMFAGKSTATYQNLVYQLAGEILNAEIDEPDYSNEWMERGVELEPQARQLYEGLFDCHIEQVGFVTPDIDNEFVEWVGISPDGLTSDSGLIEIKCPKLTTHLAYIKGDKLPSEYKYQVYFQLYVTGLDYCDFISYYPGLKPFITRVLPDKEIFAEIEAKLREVIFEVSNVLKMYNSYEYL
ncbi:MAG: lambda exonuclease family protein [Bacteroidales bacterium]